ncbi:hypothetical protein B0H19DRAFT_1187753 [Mycena capillaripes]|nr:hypothetical protein B0H19DRAFT_1187753 [Mycena capillaripes]
MKCARLVRSSTRRMPVESAVEQARRLPYARAAPSCSWRAAPRSAASIRAALRWIAQRRLYRLRRITMHFQRWCKSLYSHGCQGHRRPMYTHRVAHTRPRRCKSSRSLTSVFADSGKCARLVHFTCSPTQRLRRVASRARRSNLRRSAQQLPYLPHGFFDVPRPLRRARTRAGWVSGRTDPSPPRSLLPHWCTSKRPLSPCFPCTRSPISGPVVSSPRRRSEWSCDVPRRAGSGTSTAARAG